MAQIISQVDPNTGRRVKVAEVPGRTIKDRQAALTSTFGISKREANKLSNADIAARLGGPITSDSLSGQPSFNIQTQPPSTAVQGLLGQFEASGDQFTKQLQQQAEISRDREATAFESLFKELAGQATPAQLTADAYKTDVDPLTKEVTGLNNQLLAEQHSLRRQQEAIEKNPEGMLRSQVANELERVERESLKKQADIAVILNAKQGMLEDARAIADRAVDAEISFQQKKIDLLQLNYNRNKFLFDKDEQRAFETQQADRQRELDRQDAELKNISDLSLNALENGAPSSVVMAMRNAKSVNDAINAGGQYVNLLDRQAKYASIANSNTNRLLALAQAGDPKAIEELGFNPAKIPVEIDPTTKRQQTDKIEATDRLIGLASQYKSLIDKYGYTNEIFGNSTVVGQINSIRAQMTAAYKSAETLGTLDRGVLDLMDQLLGAKPTSSIIGFGDEGNIFANTTGRRSDKISASLETFINEAVKSKAQSQLRLGIDPTQDYLLNADDEAEVDQFLNASTFNAANYY